MLYYALGFICWFQQYMKILLLTSYFPYLFTFLPMNFFEDKPIPFPRQKSNLNLINQCCNNSSSNTKWCKKPSSLWIEQLPNISRDDAATHINCGGISCLLGYVVIKNVKNWKAAEKVTGMSIVAFFWRPMQFFLSVNLQEQGNNPGQAVHTRASVTKQYILVPVTRQWFPRLGR